MRLWRDAGFQPFQSSWKESTGELFGSRVQKEREQSTVSGLSCPQLPLWHLGGHKMGKTMALQSLACQDITGHRDEAAHKAWELPHPMQKPGDGCHEATAA